MGIKNLLFKRVSEMASVNKQLETGKRAVVDSEYYNVFISNCKKELKETNQCICFTLEQVNNLINYYGDNNLYYEPVEYYYVIKPKRYVVMLLHNKEYRKPITDVIDLREVVLRYE